MTRDTLRHPGLATGALLVTLVALCAAALLSFGAPPAEAQVSRPHPSATPQDERYGLGVPQPSAQPTCPANKVTIYADAPGNCLYSCQNGVRTLIKSNGQTCALATATVTATPTVTATATATVTVTVTPTPTVTATP